MITLSLPILAALALVGLAAVVLTSRRRMLARSTVRAARRAESVAATDETTRTRLAGAKRWLAVHDALLSVFVRRHLTRAERLRPMVRHRIAGLRLATTGAIDALVVHLAARSAADRSPWPKLGARAVRLVNVGAFLGDIAVTSMAIMAFDAEVNLVLAAVASLAIASALWTLGKLLGVTTTKLLLDDTRKLRPSLIVIAVLAAFAVALVVLRFGSPVAWLVLGVAPAFAAGAATVLGPSNEHRKRLETERDWRRARRRVVRASRALGSMAGRVASHTTAAASVLVRDLVAREQAIGAGAGTMTPTEDLTATVTDIQTVLQRLGISSSPTEVAAAQHEVSHLLDRLDAVLLGSHTTSGPVDLGLTTIHLAPSVHRNGHKPEEVRQ